MGIDLNYAQGNYIILEKSVKRLTREITNGYLSETDDLINPNASS